MANSNELPTKIEDLRDERVPNCLYWTIDDVANWIEELGLVNYKDCFVSNFIDGKRLILIDTSTLPKIGVCDMQHIELIAEKIRELLTIEKPFWNRSISLAPKDELGMYLERKSKTGEKSDECSYTSFCRDFDEQKWQPPLANHCLILPHD